MMKYSKVVSEHNLLLFEGEINALLNANENKGDFLSISTNTYIINGKVNHVAVLVFEMKN